MDAGRDDAVLATLIEALEEGALVFDAQGACRVVGRRAAEVLGTDAATLRGLARQALLEALGHAVDPADALAALDPPAHERTVVDPLVLQRPLGEATGPRSGAYPRTLVWTSVPLPECGRLDLLRDVTRERRAEETALALTQRLELESTVDELTGVANVRRFEEDCLREHRRSQREWVSYAVACVDVDGMEALNAKLGRPGGDALLRRVGEDLNAHRREYDVVARAENDEFLLLLPKSDSRSLPSVLSRAIAQVHAGARALLADRGDVGPPPTVCMGAALWAPPSAESPEEILRRARAALAAARTRGPGHVEIDAGGGWTHEGPSS